MPSQSKTPLAKKFGLKEGFVCSFVNPFSGLRSLLHPLPDKVKFYDSIYEGTFNVIIWCCNDLYFLEENLPMVMQRIYKNGCIWVCWYKKASKKQKTVNEDKIRDSALALGLVDVKVCAVNEEWSGLKLVYRLQNR